MTPIKMRLASALIWLQSLVPTPPQEPMKVCDCGTSNEPWRTSCIGCGAQI